MKGYDDPDCDPEDFYDDDPLRDAPMKEEYDDPDCDPEDFYDDDPLRDAPMKEEPDCYACCDRYCVRAGRLNRLLLGRIWVQCPSCNPTRATAVYQRLGLWRIRGFFWTLTHWRTSAVRTDEPPF